MAWAQALWATEGGKNFPSFFLGVIMNTLSIFIDESGDFGNVKEKPSYYLVTMVFHNQKVDLSNHIFKLDESIKNDGFDIDYIHTGPIIRREEGFDSFSLDERRSLIYKILNFYNSYNISHITVLVNRKEAPDKISLSGRLAKEIRNIIVSHQQFFDSFDNVIVYYDNGQSELSSILNAVFSICISNVEFRKAEQQKYRLLQVADFICSIELLKVKRGENRLSKSEEKFFYKSQELKKTFIKSIDKKALK